jgi:hypothetical protein
MSIYLSDIGYWNEHAASEGRTQPEERFVAYISYFEKTA